MICEKRSISATKIPKLKDVLYVEGLKANIISISQICNNTCSIKFIHNECIMYDSSINIMVKGINAKDNFYCIDRPPANYVQHIKSQHGRALVSTFSFYRKYQASR